MLLLLQLLRPKQKQSLQKCESAWHPSPGRQSAAHGPKQQRKQPLQISRFVPRLSASHVACSLISGAMPRLVHVPRVTEEFCNFLLQPSIVGGSCIGGDLPQSAGLLGDAFADSLTVKR